MKAKYHLNSLKNFLEIVDQGTQLRVRLHPKAKSTKSTKLDEQIACLKEDLRLNSNL